MTYTNPVLRYSADEFTAAIARAGAAGPIMADLPFEEAAPYLKAAHRHGVGMALCVAPTSSAERLGRIAAAGPAFLSGVATLGMTGERESLAPAAAALADPVRAATDVPLVLGVGISTAAQASAAGRLSTG